MNLYLISQSENNDYDTYDSLVVAANSKNEARNIHPHTMYDGSEVVNWEDEWSPWASSPDKVEVKLIGKAVKGTSKGIILASFNAGQKGLIVPIKDCIDCGRQIFDRPGYVCSECEHQDWYESTTNEEESTNGTEEE